MNKIYMNFCSAHADFEPSGEHQHFQDYFEEVRDYLEGKGCKVISCNEDCIIYEQEQVQELPAEKVLDMVLDECLRELNMQRIQGHDTAHERGRLLMAEKVLDIITECREAKH